MCLKNGELNVICKSMSPNLMAAFVREKGAGQEENDLEQLVVGCLTLFLPTNLSLQHPSPAIFSLIEACKGKYVASFGWEKQLKYDWS